MPVTFVNEDENVDPDTGALVAVFVLTYKPEDHGGSFTVDAPKTGDTVGVAQANVAQLNQTLDALYSIQ